MALKSGFGTPPKPAPKPAPTVSHSAPAPAKPLNILYNAPKLVSVASKAQATQAAETASMKAVTQRSTIQSTPAKVVTAINLKNPYLPGLQPGLGSGSATAVPPSTLPIANPTAGMPPPDNSDGSDSGSSGSSDSGGSDDGGSSQLNDGSQQADQSQDQDQDQQDQGQQNTSQQDSSSQDSGDDGSGDDGSGDYTVSPDSDGNLETDPSSYDDGFGTEAAPRISGYIQNNTLCAMGLCNTPWGTIPLITGVPVKAPNGPVQFGVDPAVDAAIQESVRRLMQGSDKETQRLAVESLVRRANQGDQNAMALIQMIGVNARAGDPKAKFSAECIQRYVAAHPKSADGAISGEREDRHYMRGAVRLANGPPLNNQRIRAIASTFGGKRARKRKLILKAAHTFGAEEISHQDLMQKLDTVEKRLYELGLCIGMAYGLQCVRTGGPISKLSKGAAWEMGE